MGRKVGNNSPRGGGQRDKKGKKHHNPPSVPNPPPMLRADDGSRYGELDPDVRELLGIEAGNGNSSRGPARNKGRRSSLRVRREELSELAESNAPVSVPALTTTERDVYGVSDPKNLPDLTSLSPREITQIKQALKLRVIQEFLADQPKLQVYKEWCQALAYRLKCPVPWVTSALHGYNQHIEAGVEVEGYKVAKALATTMGASLAKVIRVHDEAMDAVKLQVISMLGPDGKPLEGGMGIEISVPDHAVRLKAAHQMAGILNAYAPTKTEVTLDATDNFASMTEDQLRIEYLRYASKAIELATATGAKPEQVKKLLDAATPAAKQTTDS